jgi:pimeloyl-ACP methyl ester carboxylesterase
VIRYDLPGTGLSIDDTDPGGDLDDEVAALAAVVEAADAGPVDLFAGSSGAPIGVAYAVAYPERVRRLSFYGGYASGAAIADERSRKAIVSLVREHWGLGSRALADVFIPSATAQEREQFVDFQRQAASADRAAASLESVYRFDVTDLLGQVPPGAVVLHRRRDRAIRSSAAVNSPRASPTRLSSRWRVTITSPGSAILVHFWTLPCGLSGWRRSPRRSRNVSASWSGRARATRLWVSALARAGISPLTPAT